MKGVVALLGLFEEGRGPPALRPRDLLSPPVVALKGSSSNFA